MQREKFKGVNAEDWPYTTKAPENDNGNVCSPLWGVGGGLDTIMLKYQIYQSQLKDSPSFGKFYARIISDGTIDVKELAEHMAKHNTPFSPGTITGIITDAIACIKELALDGKRITLDGLVSIGLSITHKMGAVSADEFSVSKNVDKVKLVAMGVGEFSSSLLTTQAKLKESNTYQSPRTSSPTTDEPEPETPGGGTDNTDPGSGSDPNGGGSSSGSGSDTGGEDYYE